MAVRSLPDALEDAAARATGSAFFHHEDGVVRVSTSELVVRAKRRASQLVAHGLSPGDTVGLLGRTSVEWVEWAVAVWFAGGTLVPLQFPIRIRAPEAFREATASRVGAARCRLVACGPEVAGFDSHQLPTELFAADPALWLRLFGETRCTMTTAPASAWAAAVRAARRHETGVDLSSVRSAIVSAETIDADVVDDLIAFGAS